MRPTAHVATDDDGTCQSTEDLCGAPYLTCSCACVNDADTDGICDESEVPGCQNDAACNYNFEATDDDGSCEWSSCAGCTYIFACNFDPEALYSDGSCEFGTCPGCTDPTACNFNPTVSEDDGSCQSNDECGVCGGSGPDEGYTCDGSCVDTDSDGTCDFDEAGCTDAEACNYAPLAEEEDGSCTYPAACFDCAGACMDANLNGLCDCEEVLGCTASTACNFDPLSNVDDGSCANWEYLEDGCLASCASCLGILEADTDNDGVCDAAELLGCTAPDACNFEGCATDDDDSCWYPQFGYDCEGNCTLDEDFDGVCDPEETLGCDQCDACNFAPEATEDDGSCEFDCYCSLGTIWSLEEGGCVLNPSDLTAACGEGTYWDPTTQTCQTFNSCPEDLDGDGIVTVSDLLQLLGSFGENCEVITLEWACGELVSYQGYNYSTVQIGEQCWFAENLRAQSYSNGDVINTGLGGFQWANTTSGAVTYYGDDPSASCIDYSPIVESCNPEEALIAFGRIYNWHAVGDSRGLCPAGWHVPSDNDFIEFEVFLGIDDNEVQTIGWRGTIEGNLLKTETGWHNGGNGTNLYGFNLVPGGARGTSGQYDNAGRNGYLWSSSSLQENSAFYRRIEAGNSQIARGSYVFAEGYSVRCLKDSE